MSNKKIIRRSAMALCVMIAVSALFLYRGFEITIKPEQLEPGMNARLPIGFHIDTKSHVDFDRVAEQVIPRNCDSMGSSGKLECLFRNVFITPILQVATLLPVLTEKWLKTVGHVVSIPVTVKRFENVRMDGNGDIRVTGYIVVKTPFTDGAELPVDIALTTHADVEKGVIEVSSQLPHRARDYLESWKAIITIDTFFSSIPINFSDPRLRLPASRSSNDAQSDYSIDLNKELFWFSLLKPFLRGIRLDERGITITYGV